MKKVFFALAILAASFGSFAQTGRGETADGPLKEHSSAASAEEKAKNLNARITRITGVTEKGTVAELYNASLTFFKAKAEIQASLATIDQATALKKLGEARAKREDSFKKILGDRYSKLETARKQNAEKRAKAEKGAFIDEAIDE